MSFCNVLSFLVTGLLLASIYTLVSCAGSLKVLAPSLVALLFLHYVSIYSRLHRWSQVDLALSFCLLLWACDMTTFCLLQLLLVQNAVPSLCLIRYLTLSLNLKVIQGHHQDSLQRPYDNHLFTFLPSFWPASNQPQLGLLRGLIFRRMGWMLMKNALLRIRNTLNRKLLCFPMWTK